MVGRGRPGALGRARIPPLLMAIVIVQRWATLQWLYRPCLAAGLTAKAGHTSLRRLVSQSCPR